MTDIDAFSELTTEVSKLFHREQDRFLEVFAPQLVSGEYRALARHMPPIGRRISVTHIIVTDGENTTVAQRWVWIEHGAEMEEYVWRICSDSKRPIE